MPISIANYEFKWLGESKKNVDSCFRTIVVCMCMFWSMHTRPFSLEPPCHADSSLPWHPAQSDAALMAMKVYRDMTKHVQLSVHYFFWGSQLCLCHLLVPLGKQFVEHLVAGRGNLSSYCKHFGDTLSEWNPATSDLQNSPLLGISLQPGGQHRYKLNSHSPKILKYPFSNFRRLNCGFGTKSSFPRHPLPWRGKHHGTAKEALHSPAPLPWSKRKIKQWS